jgi:hypothetical protein
MKNYPDSKHENSLAIGEKYQDVIAKRLKALFGIEIHYYTTKEDQYKKGESIEGWEIKYDSWIGTSNRLSIEIGEKTRRELKEFTASGIFRVDNTFVYVQGDDNTAWIFFKADLLRYFIKKYPVPIIEDKPPTIQKFYIGIEVADRLAIKKIKVKP